MRETRLLMGMPITVEIVDDGSSAIIDDMFAYLATVDARFSTYRTDSEISAINFGRRTPGTLSPDMRDVLDLAARTQRESGGYFEIRRPDGSLDPSGIVKGWAIRKAADRIRLAGVEHFFVDAGGDIQPSGRNAEGGEWTIGIRNPFDPSTIVKAIAPRGRGVATSGSYVRGRHIYNPHRPDEPIDDIVSLTVIGPDVLEADRFATAAFAMGRAGIHFIETLPGFEGYVVDASGIATQTSGFKAFVIS